MHVIYGCIFAILIAVSSSASAQDIAPESPSALRTENSLRAEGGNFMVAAAHPLAVEAAYQILERGGRAIDAAIAAQMVLNVIEPQSSGIGGGGFLLRYDAHSKAVSSWDGRETAPASVDEALFLDSEGRPLPFMEAVKGGRSVGVPGLLRMLWDVHQRHGKLPWSELFVPAITLARQGYPMTERMQVNVAAAPYIRHFPATAALYLLPDGTPKPIGATLHNLQLGDTLEHIAQEGIIPFYQGDIAGEIVDAAQHSPVNPGTLSRNDLAGYQAKERPSLCRNYRGYKICSMPPPSSGGVTILQALGMLEHFSLNEMAPNSVQAVHVLAEVLRLAFTDRNLCLADSDYVFVPIEAMLEPAYLAKRAGMIQESAAMQVVAPGAVECGHATITPKEEPASTTHLSVVDREGNAISMTSSIEHAYGSGLMVGGFLLNNQLTDFDFVPVREGAPAANRVQPGKRPRSSMSPTLVFNPDGTLKLVVGSPGGARIIPFVLQILVAVLDWKLPLEEALALPRVSEVGGPIELEERTPLDELRPELEAMGHRVSIRPLVSGVHAVERVQGHWVGGADLRREGSAKGQ